jgi:DNA-binding MarR family transcriptional regulator
MVDKSPVKTDTQPKARLSDEALETSRLLLAFLHAAYATRRTDTNQADGAAGGAADTAVSATGSPALSNHAVRAAIHIYQHGERTIGQLASGLGISYGWASRVVEELEAVDYVIRERDVDDRRVVRVRLNPEKLKDVERAYEWHGRAVEDALDPLTESQREAVRVFLRRVIELLRQGRPERP